MDRTSDELGRPAEKRHSDESLASLLRDELGELESPRQLHAFDRPDNPLDPQKWSRRKKIFVAVTIAIYT